MRSKGRGRVRSLIRKRNTRSKVLKGRGRGKGRVRSLIR